VIFSSFQTNKDNSTAEEIFSEKIAWITEAASERGFLNFMDWNLIRQILGGMIVME
jgi:hypothetical protein